MAIGVRHLAAVALIICHVAAQPTPDCPEDTSTQIKLEMPRYTKFAEGRGMVPDPEVGYGAYLKLPKDFEVGTPMPQDGSAGCVYGGCEKEESVVAEEKQVLDTSVPTEARAEVDMNEGEKEIVPVPNPNYETWEKAAFDLKKLSGREEGVTDTVDVGNQGSKSVATSARAKLDLTQKFDVPDGMELDGSFDTMNPPQFADKVPVGEAAEGDEIVVEATSGDTDGVIDAGKAKTRPTEGTGPNGLVVAPRVPNSEVAAAIKAQKKREYDEAVEKAIAIAKDMMPIEEFGPAAPPPAVDVPMLPDVPADDLPAAPDVGEHEIPVERIFITPSPSPPPSSTPSPSASSDLSLPEDEWVDCNDAPNAPPGDGMVVGQYPVAAEKGQELPDQPTEDEPTPMRLAGEVFEKLPMRNQEEKISAANFRTHTVDSFDGTMDDEIIQNENGQAFSMQDEMSYNPRPDVRVRTMQLAADDMGSYNANLTALEEINNKASYLSHDIINTQSPLRQFLIKEELKANELSHNVTWALMNDPQARPIIEPPAESPIPSPSPSLTSTATPSPSPSMTASPSATPSASRVINYTNHSVTPSPSPSHTPLPSELVEPVWSDYGAKYQMPEEIDENEPEVAEVAAEYVVRNLKQNNEVIPGEMLKKNGVILGDALKLARGSKNQQPFNHGTQDPLKVARTALTPDQLNTVMHLPSMQREAAETPEGLENAFRTGEGDHVFERNGASWGGAMGEMGRRRRTAAGAMMLQDALRMQGEETPRIDRDQGGLVGSGLLSGLLRLQQTILGSNASNATNATEDAGESVADTGFLSNHQLDLLDVRGFDENPNTELPKNPLPLPWAVPRKSQTAFLHPGIDDLVRLKSQNPSVRRGGAAMPSREGDREQGTVEESIMSDTSEVAAHHLSHVLSIRSMYSQPEITANAMIDRHGVPSVKHDAGGLELAEMPEETCSFRLTCDACIKGGKSAKCVWCPQLSSCEPADANRCAATALAESCEADIPAYRPPEPVEQVIADCDKDRGEDVVDEDDEVVPVEQLKHSASVL